MREQESKGVKGEMSAMAAGEILKAKLAFRSREKRNSRLTNGSPLIKSPLFSLSLSLPLSCGSSRRPLRTIAQPLSHQR